jgi:hypothetical protein
MEFRNLSDGLLGCEKHSRISVQSFSPLENCPPIRKLPTEGVANCSPKVLPICLFFVCGDEAF